MFLLVESAGAARHAPSWKGGEFLAALVITMVHCTFMANRNVN